MKCKTWMALIMALGLAKGVAQEAQPNPAPDPNAIIEGARMAATLVKLEDGLTGQLRKGREKTPVTLFLKGKNIQFQYSVKGQPWRIFHMRLADENFELLEIIKGKTRKFDRNKLVEPIAGTDLTYEDLALRFLYWPNPKLLKVEDVSGQDCYRVRIEKPEGVAGNYESVEVWVHVKYGAFMRIRGYDGNGTLIKEFQVEDVMRVDKDTWTLHKMQVSTHDSKNGRRLSITELVFDKPNKPKPRAGLR